MPIAAVMQRATEAMHFIARPKPTPVSPHFVQSTRSRISMTMVIMPSAI